MTLPRLPLALNIWSLATLALASVHTLIPANLQPSAWIIANVCLGISLFLVIRTLLLALFEGLYCKRHAIPPDALADVIPLNRYLHDLTLWRYAEYERRVHALRQHRDVPS